MGFIKELMDNHNEKDSLSKDGLALFNVYRKSLEWGGFIGILIHFLFFFDSGSSTEPLSEEQKSILSILKLIAPFIGSGLIGCALGIALICTVYVGGKKMHVSQVLPLVLKGKLPRTWLNS